LRDFEAICGASGVRLRVVGTAEKQPQLTLSDDAVREAKPDRPAVADPLRKAAEDGASLYAIAIEIQPLDLKGVTIADAVERLLRLPAIASKSFLITIGDRSISGLVVQDQMVGPWQVPVADCAVTLRSYDSTWARRWRLESERRWLSSTPPRLRAWPWRSDHQHGGCVIEKLGDIKLSANWMAAAGEGQEDQKLFDAVHAVGMEFCPALGISIPVGKDSMSMKTKWREGSDAKAVVSPLSLIASGFAPVGDVRKTLTPQLHCMGTAALILIDLGGGKNRLGGSCLAQVYGQVGDETPDAPSAERTQGILRRIQQLNREGKLLAYHDRSDGGLFVTLRGDGVRWEYRSGYCAARRRLAETLFSEELGAVVQVATNDLDDVLARLNAFWLADAGCSDERVPRQ
jgi:phosphoribosylformylglycinamidine synthase